MSLIELIVIVFISLGIFDKTKILSYYKRFSKLQNGQVRQIIGDNSINEQWVWLNKDEEE